ncbi:MAG TPA: PQQ-binding-like beta-propeller repeat protein, partial [Bryobacteraceae bacterium]|nr:PQQ-binding-like beta-propeller repeat protein [Bryobacteraceae bacterium]
MLDHPGPGTAQLPINFACARPLALAISLILFFHLSRARADDWVMAFHDARHTGQTSEVVTPPLTLAWTWKDTEAYDLGDNGKFVPQPYFWLPIYYQGQVYLQGGNNANRVFCLNPATGAELWEWDNPGYAQAGTYLFQFYNYPTAVDGRIVNASTDFTASFDAATGANTQSAYNTNGGWPFGGAAAWNNMAYIQFVRTDDGTEAFHVIQDPVAWVIPNPDSYYSPDNKTTFTDDSFRVPAVDNYTAYVNMLGQLNAFNATTGWQMWTWGQMDDNSSPAVSNGVVYFYALDQGSMMALNVAGVSFNSSGVQVPVLWSVSMPAADTPIVSEGTVYAGAADGNFYALNAATGSVEWTFKTGAPFTPLQIPAISGNLIYVPGADGTLYVLQKSTGAEVWHYTGTAAWGPVVIAGGLVFTSDLTNTFYAFQPQSAAIGPAVTALSLSLAPNNAPAAVNLTGSGFFGGGSASAVQSVFLDDNSGTPLTGYTVASDQSITGAVIPAGIAPGTYHIRVQTGVGQTANEPTFTVQAANTIAIATLGYSTGPNSFGTNLGFQRHLVRTSNGTLVAVYIGPASGEPQYPTYNFSFDGGLTWSGQGQLALSNAGTVIYSPTTSIWVDPQGQINISSIQWPTYNQTFQKFAINSAGVMAQDTGFPVYPSGGGADLPSPIVSEAGGRLWLALETGGNLTGYYSDNGGVNWTGTAQINKSSASPAAMVLYQGHPAVIYSDGGSLAWSAWNGQSWSAPQLLPGSISGVGQSMSAVVTSNGQVNLVYSPAKGGVYYAAYAGQSWTVPAALDPAGTSPSLTTDGANLWAFYTNAGGNLVYRQTSNGVWNAAVALTSDGNQNTAPTTLELSTGGQVPVVWTSGSSTAGYWVKAAVVSGSGGANPPALPTDAVPALSITKTNAAAFHQGESSATYSVTVSNAASAGATSGTVTVTDTEPTGLTLVSIAGSGWTCSGAACTRSDALSAGASYPSLTVTVNVAANAAASLTSSATVSGGGSASATAADVTAITPVPALSISQTNAAAFHQGENGATYSVTVSNAASAGATSGTVTVTDTEPAGLTLVSLAGTGWTCSGAACTRTDALSAGASYPPLTVTVNVAANAAASLTSSATVSGGGSASATASDVTTITAIPALSISKTNAAAFHQGENSATYSVTVSNAAAAGATSGTVTVTDTEPTGLTLISIAGSGWTCSGAACTRNDALSAGASYPALTITVNVAANAAASLTSSATVSGGGSASATASDVTAITAVPALSITKTNAAAFRQGENSATYTITVSNAASAAPTSGTVTVTDTEPTGLTLVSIAGSGWTCSGAACTRSDALGAGASYPPLTVTVNVAANAAATLTSSATVSGGGSASATASDVTAITAVPALSISKTNAAAFHQGENSATYSVTVSNAASAGATSGTVTVTDTEPTGLTLVSLAGSGWTCSGAACSRTDALSAGASYPALTITVNVAANAAASLTSSATVSGGGSASATASDVTAITAVPALSISKTNAAVFHQGQNGATYSVTVSNAAAAAPTSGTVTVTDTEPTGLTLVSIAGTGWTCSGAACTRNDALSAGASYPPLTVTVNVAANAATSLTSSATVSGGGSASATASDVTAITAVPALSITKTNAAAFRQGQNGATYSVTVSNAASAAPTSGTVTVTDTEPTGLTLASIAGTGWTCSGAACTRTDALSAGASYPALTVTVNVAANAAASVTSSATVSGGGSASATASDVTAITPVCAFTSPAAVTLTNAVPASGTPSTQSFSISVAPRGGCTPSTTWTASSTAGTYWLTITSGTTGNGGSTATLQGSGLSNTQPAARSGTITLTPSTG